MTEELERGIFTHPEPFQLGGGVTIDTAVGQYDNGFLACARTGWSSPLADSNFVQAAQNLASYQVSGEQEAGPLNTKMLVLVGHGNQGVISTGDGMIYRTAQGYISTSNYSAWAPYFSNVRGHGIFLTLCGCDCGAGAAGAQFLYQLATLLNMPVQGRTGLVYLRCPGAYISYENGSVWQVAQPGVLPSPINPPTGYVQSGLPSELWTARTGRIDTSSIESASITTIAGREVELDRDQSISLLGQANLDRPMVELGSVAATLTGTIAVKMLVEGVGIRQVFLVFNDRLLQHEGDKTTFNLCSPGFSQEFRALLAR